MQRFSGLLATPVLVVCGKWYVDVGGGPQLCVFFCTSSVVLCAVAQATTLLQALKDGEEDEHVLVRLIESAPSIDQVDEVRGASACACYRAGLEWPSLVGCVQDGCTVLHLAAAASIPVELLGKVLQASADDAVTLIDHVRWIACLALALLVLPCSPLHSFSADCCFHHGATG